MFAGTVTAIGAWILLELLGAGIGLSAIDTTRGSNAHAVGMGTGIWSIIAPLIALFLGALVGARLCGTYDRRIGALHGVVMWGLTSALGLMAIIATVSAIASGVARVGTAAATVAGSAVQAAAPTAQALGVQPNANEASEKIQQSMNSAQQKADQLQEQATQTALDAAHTSGRAMLWAGIGELVALLAALAGGALGVARMREPVVAEPEVVAPA